MEQRVDDRSYVACVIYMYRLLGYHYRIFLAAYSITCHVSTTITRNLANVDGPRNMVQKQSQSGRHE